MALTTRSPGQSPIDSSAINQFVNLLTGVDATQPVTLANTLTVTQTITGSSNFVILGTTNVHSINSCTSVAFSSNLAVFGTITQGSAITTFFSSTIANIAAPITLRGTVTSSQRVAINLGSSGPTVLWGSSVPTASALPGSIFLNQGGSSTTMLYVAGPNSGGASSSNWVQVNGYA